jgi:aryl-alcohol dehydrogenase-like predicted oxidoreductase
VDYRYLGTTGLRISALSLGAQTFGWNTTAGDAGAILDRYRESGGNYIDVADSYNGGESERIVGAWVESRRARREMLLGTKVFFPTGTGPNDAGLSRRHILDSVDESLGRLRTDWIDLYQLHCFDRMTPLEETLGALDHLVRSGRVRYVGVSNFTPSQLAKGLMICGRGALARLSTLQLEYSLLVRSPEWELLPLCAEEGVGTLAWSPLAGGWLSGKYRRDGDLPAESRAGRGDRWDDASEQRGGEHTWGIIEELQHVAAENGRVPAQVALNWLLCRKAVTCPIMGARTVEQLEENLGAVGWALTAGEVERLDRASAVPEPYPYSFINRYTRRDGGSPPAARAQDTAGRTGGAAIPRRDPA